MSENLYGYKGNRDNHKGTAEASGVNQQTLSDLAGIGLNTLVAVAYRRTTLYNKRYS